MANKAKRPCNHVGCGELTSDSYCAAHKKLKHRQYKQQRTDKKEQDFYSSTRWRRVRAKKMANNPLCEICLSNGLLTGADMVDHIKPIKQGGALLDMSNLQSLCNSCHRRKTAKE
ncbi:HNH endonuclease signature motif containing protein [Peribacillus castrilensis]|uniref:HNH endonuclease signature motif containing protein n=1 Tax=Peribacillus castrilensis TaxID=2897690 RepID=UPI003D2E0CC8